MNYDPFINYLPVLRLTKLSLITQSFLDYPHYKMDLTWLIASTEFTKLHTKFNFHIKSKYIFYIINNHEKVSARTGQIYARIQCSFSVRHILNTSPIRRFNCRHQTLRQHSIHSIPSIQSKTPLAPLPSHNPHPICPRGEKKLNLIDAFLSSRRAPRITLQIVQRSAVQIVGRAILCFIFLPIKSSFESSVHSEHWFLLLRPRGLEVARF